MVKVAKQSQSNEVVVVARAITDSLPPDDFDKHYAASILQQFCRESTAVFMDSKESEYRQFASTDARSLFYEVFAYTPWQLWCRIALSIITRAHDNIAMVLVTELRIRDYVKSAELEINKEMRSACQQ